MCLFKNVNEPVPVFQKTKASRLVILKQIFYIGNDIKIFSSMGNFSVDNKMIET